MNISWPVLLILSLLGEAAWSEVCLNALNTNTASGDPPFMDDNSHALPANREVQAIITTYNFSCCVNVTSWETYMRPDSGSHRDGNYDITFQIWRPSPTIQENGCYSLVGQNVFTSITFMNNAPVILVPQDNYVIAQVGDVVGYSTNSRDDNNEGIQLDISGQYSQNMVWYHAHDGSLEIGNQNCPFPIGSETDRILRTATHAAPMLRIKTIITDVCTSDLINPSSATSMNSVLPSSYAVSPTASEIPNLNKESNRGRTLIAIVVTTVAAVTLVSFFTVMLLLLLRKRKRASIQIQSNSEILLDLINPNYALPEFSDKPKESVRAKPKQWKPTSEKDSVKFHNKTKSVIYKKEKEIKCRNLVQCGNISEANCAQSRHPQNSEDQSAVATTGCTTSTNENIYHILEDPASSSTSHSEEIDEGMTSGYDVPIDNLKSNHRKFFECEGYYVPTLEERNEYGLHYSEYQKQRKYSKLNFFEEEAIYWTPANTTTELYSQLASKKYREIPRHQLRLHEALGSGQFGKVFKATWDIHPYKLELAVKTLKTGASDKDRVMMLQEAAIMGQFYHTNVIKMYGVVTLNEPIYICSEYLENRDLQEYLGSLKLSGTRHSDFKSTQLMFLGFAKDIAAGMSYLSRKKFLHRDLAARNILLNKSLTCKVADFGMARNLMDELYYTSSGGKIPIKWTAPEVIFFSKSAAESDVWSYGMVLFEIWSVGKKPFSTYDNIKVLKLIEEGFCQPPPPGCPKAIYKLMVDCWNPEYKARPSFVALSKTLLEQPKATLLHWDNDDTLPSTAGICGGPLEDAKLLYIKLQKTYS